MELCVKNISYSITTLIPLCLKNYKTIVGDPSLATSGVVKPVFKNTFNMADKRMNNEF